MPRPTNTEERRAQIVRGLIAVMAKRGYDSASTSDIAAHAGLTPGLVHYHFKTKLEILIEVVRTLARDHAAAVDAALAVSDEPREQLAGFIDVHLGTGQHANRDALACWVLATAEAVRQPLIQREVDRVLTELVGRLVAIIERGVRVKQFGRVDSKAAAAALLATIQGYFVLSATARELIPPGSAAKAARQMADGLLRTRGGRG